MEEQRALMRNVAIGDAEIEEIENLALKNVEASHTCQFSQVDNGCQDGKWRYTKQILIDISLNATQECEKIATQKQHFFCKLI